LIYDLDPDELGISQPVKPDYYISDAEAERIADKLVAHGRKWSVWQFHPTKRASQNRVSDFRRRNWDFLEFSPAQLADERFAVLVRCVRPVESVAVYRVDVAAMIRDRKIKFFLDTLREAVLKPTKKVEIEAKYLKLVRK
jgi:hypothetical protein